MKTFSGFLPLAGCVGPECVHFGSFWFRVGSGKPVPVERERLHCGEKGGEKRGSCLVHEEQMRREHAWERMRCVFGGRRI